VVVDRERETERDGERDRERWGERQRVVVDGERDRELVEKGRQTSTANLQFVPDEAEFEVGDLGVLDTEVPPTEHLVAHVDVVAVA
jgi:hypothetical protein